MTDPIGNVRAFDWCEAYKHASADNSLLRAALIKTERKLAEYMDLLALIESEVRDGRSHSRLRTSTIDAIQAATRERR